MTAAHCPGCGATLKVGLLACSTCYFSRVPGRLRGEYTEQALICKTNNIKHTQRLLELESIIRNIVKPTTAGQLFAKD